MSMPPSKPSGFGGGILPPRLKSKTNSPQLFFSMRKSLTIGLTKLYSGHMYIFMFCFVLFVYFILCHF